MSAQDRGPASAGPTTAYALKVTSGQSDDGTTVAVFATSVEAADYYGLRDDLHGYFWAIRPTDSVSGAKLPRIFWSREKVAEAIADLEAP